MAFRLKLSPQNTNINFLRYQVITFGAAFLLMLASIFSIFWPGLSFGIDFKGGTTIRTETTQPLDVGQYRSALAELDLGDVIISEVFDPAFRADQHVATIRIQTQETEDGKFVAMDEAGIQRVLGALQTVDKDVRVISTESVGPKVSGELVWTAVWSLLATMVGIMIYIWVRFEWQYGVAAGVALLHDLFLTIGLFVVLEIKFDLTIVAALLTLLGYSINDTVVVFDRVRENLVKFKTMPLAEVVNLSLNETLSRTVMTSVTTLLALIPLLVLGGDVIRGFVFAMVWGVFVGTYSSIYIACSILCYLGVNRNKEVKSDPAAKLFGDKIEVPDADQQR